MPPLLHLEWSDASLDVLQLPLKPLNHVVSSLYPPCSKRIQAIGEILNCKWLLGIAIASLRLVCLLFFGSISLLLLVSAPFSGYSVVASSHYRISIFFCYTISLCLTMPFDQCVIFVMYTVILLG